MMMLPTGSIESLGETWRISAMGEIFDGLLLGRLLTDTNVSWLTTRSRRSGVSAANDSFLIQCGQWFAGSDAGARASRIRALMSFTFVSCQSIRNGRGVPRIHSERLNTSSSSPCGYVIYLINARAYDSTH
jgi:hypothetical protein